MHINHIENTVTKNFKKQIWTKYSRGIRDYKLIQSGDKILVCISGGKDSMLLAQCISRFHRNKEILFDAEYIVMNPGYNTESLNKIKENLKLLDIDAKFYETRIFESVEKEKKNPCFLCARLRRGWLYKKAEELDCNKIALGHHFDDVTETILMGILYGSQMQTILPRIKAENYNVEVIRPLYLVHESDIINWADFNNLKFINCACHVTKHDGNSKRAEIKELINQLRKTNPAVDMNIFRSAENVNLKKLISYHNGDEYHCFLDEFK